MYEIQSGNKNESNSDNNKEIIFNILSGVPNDNENTESYNYAEAFGNAVEKQIIIIANYEKRKNEKQR